MINAHSNGMRAMFLPTDIFNAKPLVLDDGRWANGIGAVCWTLLKFRFGKY